jgi:integration host factor subunit alpha
MTTLTKAEIVNAVCDDVELQHHHAKEIVDLFFEEMRTTLERGEEIKLSGFGNFELHDKRERPGRNPKTGVPVMIAPRRVVTFNAGQKLRKAVSGED